MERTASRSPGIADKRLLIIALILGAVAAGLIVAYLASRDGSTASAPPAVSNLSIVVAARVIPAGKTIELDDLAVKAIPSTAVVDGAFRRTEDAIGKTVRYPVGPGEQMSNIKLAGTGRASSLSFTIPEGMRGFTIQVSVDTSPAGVLAPGDFVDVLLYGKKASTGVPTTGAAQPGSFAVITLFQNIQVISIERNFVPVADGYEPSTRGEPPKEGGVDFVTLALTPEQAQTLWLAISIEETNLTLSLRPFGDDSVAPLAGATEPIVAQ